VRRVGDEVVGERALILPGPGHSAVAVTKLAQLVVLVDAGYIR
jgi:hypothetical protein